MKYKCLLIDHDDTAVNSTPHIHYLAHQEQMRRLNRDEQILSLDDWFRVNYHPGIHSYLQDELKLSREEEQFCYEVWREFTQKVDPPFFPGMLELLKDFTERGGRVFVISHSEKDIIQGHYQRQQEFPGFIPEEIFGWTHVPEHNKPYTWPIEQVVMRFGFKSEEMLMMDDLKPGIIMARKAGVDSLAAGWSHAIPEIQKDLAEKSTVFFDNLRDASLWILN